MPSDKLPAVVGRISFFCNAGIRLIEELGPFEIHGDPDLLRPLDALLGAFARQRRMKLAGDYQPCYRVVA